METLNYLDYLCDNYNQIKSYLSPIEILRMMKLLTSNLTSMIILKKD